MLILKIHYYLSEIQVGLGFLQSRHTISSHLLSTPDFKETGFQLIYLLLSPGDSSRSWPQRKPQWLHGESYICGYASAFAKFPWVNRNAKPLHFGVASAKQQGHPCGNLCAFLTGLHWQERYPHSWGPRLTRADLGWSHLLCVVWYVGISFRVLPPTKGYISERHAIPCSLYFFEGNRKTTHILTQCRLFS